MTPFVFLPVARKDVRMHMVFADVAEDDPGQAGDGEVMPLYMIQLVKMLIIHSHIC